MILSLLLAVYGSLGEVNSKGQYPRLVAHMLWRGEVLVRMGCKIPGLLRADSKDQRVFGVC